MRYRIYTTKTFDRSLKKLSKAEAGRVLEKLDELSEDRSPIHKLKHTPVGMTGLSRVRVGQWRVLLWLDKRKKEITLYRVAHRREIYRNL